MPDPQAEQSRGRVSIGRDGFALLDEVLSAINEGPRTKGNISGEAVLAAVAEDEKGRFELDDGPDGLRIRALSGHSFEVDIPGTDFTPAGPLWFGTSAAERIEQEGLTGSTKLKVRLRRTREEAGRIASGRKGDPLIVEVDAVRLAADGHRFSLLSNGEVVTGHFGRDY